MANRPSVEKMKEELSADLTERSKGQLDLIKSDLYQEVDKKVKEVGKKMVGDIKKEARGYIDQTQFRTTEVLAIFVALFTFVSINISIFHEIRSLFSGVVFMVLMALVILFFLTPLLLILRGPELYKERSKAIWVTLIISTILLSIILILSRFIKLPL